MDVSDLSESIVCRKHELYTTHTEHFCVIKECVLGLTLYVHCRQYCLHTSMDLMKHTKFQGLIIPTTKKKSKYQDE